MRFVDGGHCRRCEKSGQTTPVRPLFRMAKPIRLPNQTEQQVLDQLHVRLLRSEEFPKARELICQRHYLKNADLAGQQLCYVAEHADQWLALLWWSAPALHLKAREGWIGW